MHEHNPPKVDERPENGRDIAYDIIGAAIEVHNYLGAGYPVDVYRQALSREFGLRRMSFEARPEIQIHFKGREVGRVRADFVIDEKILVLVRDTPELGSLQRLEAQSLLKATRRAMAIVMSFQGDRLQFDRINAVPRTPSTDERPRPRVSEAESPEGATI